MDWSDRIGRRLKPRDLHVFMAVAEHRNIAKAAESLAISRPVVSRTIAELERTLGVPLFDRSSHGVEPTLYGDALLKRSVVIFDEMQQSVKEIEFLSDPNAGELRVGCTEPMAAGFVSAVIHRLCRRYPRLTFQLEIANAATLQMHSLRKRKCELAIARKLEPLPEPDMDAEVLFQDKFFVVAGPKTTWRGRQIALARLLDEPWIVTRVDLQPGSPIFDAFRAGGLEIRKPKIVCDSLNLRNSLLASGRYLTILHGSVLRFGVERRLLRVLPVELSAHRLPVSVITLKNRTLSPIAELFIKCAREVAKTLAKEGSSLQH